MLDLKPCDFDSGLAHELSSMFRLCLTTLVPDILGWNSFKARLPNLGGLMSFLRVCLYLHLHFFCHLFILQNVPIKFAATSLQYVCVCVTWERTISVPGLYRIYTCSENSSEDLRKLNQDFCFCFASVIH